jgi:Virulence-associated protein E
VPRIKPPPHLVVVSKPQPDFPPEIARPLAVFAKALREKDASALQKLAAATDCFAAISGYDNDDAIAYAQELADARDLKPDDVQKALVAGKERAKVAKDYRKDSPPSPSKVTKLPKKARTGDWPDVRNDGHPAATCANASRAIELLGIQCRFDIFHDRKLVGGHAIEQWAGEFSDHACLMLRARIKQKFRIRSRQGEHQRCCRAALSGAPVRPGPRLPRWLGVGRLRRIDKWMTTYLGADDTELTRDIGILALVAAVRRVRDPGCKFDQIVVLESPEGSGKSSAIQILAGKENFSDQTILGLDDRQQQENLRGVWLYEIADLAGMSKAEVDKVKAFASRQDDRARPAYGRHLMKQPRRCIFIATTNNETYLKSQTGNRRFWPVKIGDVVKLESLKRDRDQLWAEAAGLERDGLPLRLSEELWATATAEQDRRRDMDRWG